MGMQMAFFWGGYPQFLLWVTGGEVSFTLSSFSFSRFRAQGGPGTL